MIRLTRFALRQPAITILLMLLLVLAGTAAAFSLNQELTPEVEFPQATIVTLWPGASANEVTDGVVKPIEDALEGITDVEVVEVSSSASESFAAVSVLAEYGVDQDALRTAIENELDDVDLPDDAETPDVVLFSFSDLPVIQASVRGNIDALEDPVLLQQLIEDEIVPELEAIDGVSQVSVAGGLEEKIFINLDPDKLSEQGVSLSSIRNALSSNDLSFPAGTLTVDGRDLPLQVVNRVSSIEALADLPLSGGGNGGPGGPPGAGPPSGSANGASTRPSSSSTSSSSASSGSTSGSTRSSAASSSAAPASPALETVTVDGETILSLPLPQAAVDLGYATTADLTGSAVQQLALLQPALLRDVADQLLPLVPAGGPSPLSKAAAAALPDDVEAKLTARLAETPAPARSTRADAADTAEPLGEIWQVLGADRADEITPDIMGTLLELSPQAVSELSPAQLSALPIETLQVLPLPFLQRQPAELRDRLLARLVASGVDANAALASLLPARPDSPEPDVLRLSDVAEVSRGPADAATLNRTDGTLSLSLLVYKDQGANTVNVANAVLDRIDDWDTSDTFDDYPDYAGEDLTFNTIFEQATYIEDSLRGVRNEGLLGALFAVVVILIFLSFSVRSTLVVALSIPLSILAALLFMRGQGLTLNLLTLAGLTIAIGRVVDDTIVVLENIYRHIQRGDDVRTSVVEGTREVATAITASTLVAVAVFLPLGFVGGITSEFFLPFGLTSSYALLASLVVAMTVVPLLAGWLLNKDVLPEEHETALQRAYRPSLEWALDHRWLTLGLATLFFLASLALVGAIDKTFLPGFGEPSVTVELQMPPGTDLANTDAISLRVEDLLSSTDGIDIVETTVGRGSQFFGELSGGDAARAFFFGSLEDETLDDNGDEKPFFERLGSEPVDAVALADTLRDDLDSLKTSLVDEGLIASTEAITFTVSGGAAGGPEGNGFDQQIRSDDEQALRQANDMILAALRDDGNWEDEGFSESPLINLTSNLSEARQVLSVQVDPARATDRGLSTVQVAFALRQVLEGEDLGDIELVDGSDSETLSVVARYPEDTLNSAEKLADYEIDSPQGEPVRLGDVATITQAPGPVEITRVDGQTAALLSAEITEGDTFGVLDAADRIIDDLDIGDEFDDEVEVGAGVQSKQQREGFADMLTALPISIIIVYLIMVVTFGSLIHPFTILFSLPFAVSGALVALFVTGRPLSLSSLIGLMMLIGIVTTNAIVLVDLVQQYRERGMDARSALIEGGSKRLRPILMTALATVFALIPQALGLTEGALIASELATTVIGGLFTSTFLTLLVVPVVYSLLDGLANRGVAPAMAGAGPGAGDGDSAIDTYNTVMGGGAAETPGEA